MNLSSPIISEINIYPIKSLGGISLSESLLEDRGLQYDRRWMLVDENNKFITQRKYSALALLKVRLKGEVLEVFNATHGEQRFTIGENTGEKMYVEIWDSTCQAVEVSKEANNYFSSYLNMKVKLVHMPDESLRQVDKDYAKNEEIVSFADAFPILLIGQASLDDLNSRLPSPVPMNRFRPNIVVSTSVPFDEDTWGNFSLGNAKFSAAKPCARCVLTTVNQATGIKGIEPLKTLTQYRNFNNKVLFGQNLLFRGGESKIKIGDYLEVKTRKN
jgi:uncharacterized protein